jgi:hypothetical protein
MQPRHLALVLGLAGVLVATAVLLARDGKPAGHSATVAAPAAQVAINLKGGSGNAVAAACGSTHHYTAYPAGATVRFDGHVVAGRGSQGSRVSVKLKACVGGTFRPSGDAKAKLRRDGTFKGSFPAPVPGRYFARASLKTGNRLAGRSDKQFFEIR